MWPLLKTCRQKLARHLISADSGCQGLDVIKIVEMCAAGLKTTCVNGLCHTQQGGLIFQTSFVAGQIPSDILPNKLTCFTLHLLWVAYSSNPTTMAMYIQSKFISAPNSQFWGKLYEWTSWIIVAPPNILPGFMTGRPDLAHFCHVGYMELLANRKTSKRVETLVEMALSCQWRYSSYTTEWQALSDCFLADGIQGFTPIQSAEINDTSLKARIRLKPTIVLNGIPVLCISDSDRIVLLMRQLFCSPFEWAYTRPPSSAPEIFFKLYDILSNPPNECKTPFDELDYK